MSMLNEAQSEGATKAETKHANSNAECNYFEGNEKQGEKEQESEHVSSK